MIKIESHLIPWRIICVWNTTSWRKWHLKAPTSPCLFLISAIVLSLSWTRLTKSLFDEIVLGSCICKYALNTSGLSWFILPDSNNPSVYTSVKNETVYEPNIKCLNNSIHNWQSAVEDAVSVKQITYMTSGFFLLRNDQIMSWKCQSAL